MLSFIYLFILFFIGLVCVAPNGLWFMKEKLSSASKKEAAMFCFEVTWQKLEKKWVMHVYRNTVAHSHNVFTSSAFLTSWSHFTRIERYYADLFLPATVTII